MNGAEQYNYRVVRQFTIATVLWGVVGMMVGVLIAAQLLWPALNFDIPWLSYGRLQIAQHFLSTGDARQALSEGEQASALVPNNLMNEPERKKAAKSNPYSFAHVVKPRINFPDEVQKTDQQLFDFANS